jgi:hypothetical protein
VILVKIGRMGGKITEYAFDNGITIERAFRVSGIKIMPDEKFELNGGTANSVPHSWKLTDKDYILISLNIVSQVNVKVGRIGEKLQEIKIPTGNTIKSALISAGRLPFSDEEIWIHWDNTQQGTRGALSTPVSEGMIIVLEKPASLRNKILKIVSKEFEDENGEWERGTNALLAMLAKDYKLS